MVRHLTLSPWLFRCSCFCSYQITINLNNLFRLSTNLLSIKNVTTLITFQRPLYASGSSTMSSNHCKFVIPSYSHTYWIIKGEYCGVFIAFFLSSCCHKECWNYDGYYAVFHAILPILFLSHRVINIGFLPRRFQFLPFSPLPVTQSAELEIVTATFSIPSFISSCCYIEW